MFARRFHLSFLYIKSKSKLICITLKIVNFHFRLPITVFEINSIRLIELEEKPRIGPRFQSDFYRISKTLQEGDVISRVCPSAFHSVQGGTM